MGICPKCNSSVPANQANCPKCGEALAGASEPSGTLNAEQHFQFADDAPTNAADEGQNIGDSRGTLGIHDFAQVALDSTEQTASPESDEQAMQSSDANKTLQIQDEGLVSNDGVVSSSTLQFSDSDLRSAMGQGDSGSEGQLKRLWDAAIGSSGKDSKHSLRYERAEASDSVFRRVATRQIADANSTTTEGADYQIQDKLGVGGMGIVYSALQTAVNRIVAIKTIKAERFEDEASRRQFFYEAEVTAELDHPNIPPIYELGRTEEGTLFYAMKLIKGIEWQKLLRKKTREENLEIFDKIADAVAFAHSKNVIHRDLKPDNVMIGTFGEVYLSDWGLAVNQSKKKEVDFGGTPEFMAPEMARNQRDRIGKHSDIYLLGAILFQIVTGSPPHMGRSQKERLQAAAQNVIVDTDLVDPLLTIARQAMDTEPNRRYASVADMQAAIGEVKKHAESINLAQRSGELAIEAAQSKEYNKFTRAVFGFYDALEMWDGNTIAKKGLQEARLAYGQCAFDKGDYDLAIQTLDRTVPKEAKVYEEATKAKLAVVQRESRFKTLRRTFIAAVSFLLLVATGFAYVANQKSIDLSKANSSLTSAKLDIEKKATELEKTNSELEKTNDALEKEKLALNQANLDIELKRSDIEVKKNSLEKAYMELGQAKTEIESANTQLTQKGDELAKTNDNLKKASMAEKEATKAAKLRGAQNKINTFVSELGRANLSTEQRDNESAVGMLSRTRDLAGDDFTAIAEDGITGAANVPKFDTFAWNRVNLLTNADLQKLSLSFGPVTAMDYSRAANVGIVGTKAGQVQVIRYDAKGLKEEDSEKFPGSVIDCVAISPNGDEAIISLTTDAKSSTYLWSLANKSKPVKAEVLGAKNFQSIRYSPDGKRIIAGIKGGIRVLNRSEKWTSQDPLDSQEIDSKRNIPLVRGDLLAIQWIDANTILASTRKDGKVNLFEINTDALTSNLLSMPKSISDSLSAAAVLGSSKRVLLANGDGELGVGELIRNEKSLSIGEVTKLPTEHKATISRLIVNTDGSIISISDKEPVVHLWRANSRGDVSYDTFLAGVPSVGPNIQNAFFVSKDSILGVDEAGTSVVWNIDRQKQRRKLERISDTGRQEYPKPVIGVYGRGVNDEAITVNEDGAIDLWNLKTGKTKNIVSQFDSNSADPAVNAARFSYFGHTPGAVFVDSVVDVGSGVIVTSASLDRAEHRYLQNPDHKWEFCVWEQSTGNMIKRWSMQPPIKLNNPSERESNEPRLTMLNDGKEILIASDTQTLLFSVLGEKLALPGDPVGTYFAVPNPKNPSLVAMIKRSGLIWLWNRSDANSGFNSSTTKAPLQSEGYPLQGVWSEDGNRFFLVFTTGLVKVYDGRDFSQPSLTSSTESTGSARKSLTIGQHHDLDLATFKVAQGIDRLVLNIRLPDATKKNPRSVMYTLDARSDRMIESERKENMGLRWLDTSVANSPKSSGQVYPGYRVNSNSNDDVVARQSSGSHTFVSTKSGTVYDMTNPSTTYTSIGNQNVLSTTADKDGSVVMLLKKDGKDRSLLRFHLSKDGLGKWEKVAYSVAGIDEIKLSPNKQRLAMFDRESNILKLVNSESGDLVQEYPDVASVAWDPSKDAVLAIVHTDGKVELNGATDPIAIRSLALENGWQIKSVHFFNEAWADGKTTRHLLIQSEAKVGQETKGHIDFVGLDPALDKVSKAIDIKAGSEIATSPVDSVFVTGDDAGTVTVWFASPNWDANGKIFDLEGHRGAKIKNITFGEHGKTLITSDANDKLYGWMSEDSTTASN